MGHENGDNKSQPRYEKCKECWMKQGQAENTELSETSEMSEKISEMSEMSEKISEMSEKI